MTDLSEAPDVDCGCAPTADEMRSFSSRISRRNALGLGILGVAAASTGLGFALPAFAATSYPSWDDVEKARNNEAAKGSEITRIQNLISSLENDVAAKQAEAERLGVEYQDALIAFEDAAARADALQAKADAEEARAKESAAKLGVLAAQQYRSGKGDATLELFFSDSSASADDLLGRLGTMDRLVGANRDVYAEAVGARDSAKSLAAQAQVARDERDKRKIEAEQKMQAAQDAAQAAQAALAAQNEHREVLEAQLDALRDTTAKTVAGYKAGVEAARKAREEAARKARAEAARKAREEEARRIAEEKRRREEAAAAAANKPKPSTGGSSSGGSSGGGSSSGGSGGVVQSSGWVRPAHGWISSWFGTRGSICGSGGCTASGHRGIDFASSCGSPIYAAASGTVVFAGYSGAWGNYIQVRHSDGTVTGYAHIINGGYNVGYGDRVRAGQTIAYIGSTGASTGCHVHFEVYRGGVRIDPAPFLRARGISV
ncbi:M23 family metallopeptidase [Microbacterium sp. CnD16-F]|uniref:peptidoglycan DD-metalloendopeptidase family protein n=1 Tax=Microbacterium sp. CnD16-F TaxID=2954493 RepID=UPI0020968AFE|nr:M23 family metallopeptidase [Microbacterium sp. CnD16-F]MCO7203255.1 M23 family metallopeptidase [Microbacterium sp. CnD16-F]